MEKLIEVVKMILEKGPDVIAAIMALLTGVIGVAMLIPGEQPEKALQAVVDFLKKFSKKPE